jgi:hypothetical protein
MHAFDLGPKRSCRPWAPVFYWRALTTAKGGGNIMHVRMNMLAGDPGLIDGATRYLETTVRPTVESQRGNRGLAVLANAELGTCVVASYW